jgi:hypothetical protein
MGAMDEEGTITPVDPVDRDPAPSPSPASGRARHRPSGRAQPEVLAVIALGGMLGASARYGINRWLPTRPGGFPWATFWTNMSGSFLLGLLLVLLLERFPPTRLVRPFLATCASCSSSAGWSRRAKDASATELAQGIRRDRSTG